MTTQRMRIACWIPKATKARPEYVILIAGHRINGRKNAPRCYSTRTMSVFFTFKLC
jgi:hypothetical protein